MSGILIRNCRLRPITYLSRFVRVNETPIVSGPADVAYAAGYPTTIAPVHSSLDKFLFRWTLSDTPYIVQCIHIVFVQ